MAEFSISQFTISIILATIIIIGGVGLLSAAYSTHPDATSQAEIGALNTTFYKYDQIQSSAQELKNSITGTNQSSSGSMSAIDSLISGSWNSIKLFYSSFSFVFTFFDGLATMAMVPSWIIGLITAIIIILVGYAVYSLVFGRNA